jgi:uncharacterized MAPEG superfamily protein
MEQIMTASQLCVVALSFCLPLTAAAPALARSPAKAGHNARAQAVPNGYNARAQAAEPAGTEGVSAKRAKALQECNDESGKLSQKDYGVRQTSNYGSCMMTHGEME